MKKSKFLENYKDDSSLLPGSKVVQKNFCWSRNLEHPYDKPLQPFVVSGIGDAISQIGSSFRFLTGYYLQEKWHGRVPTFDPFFHNVTTANQKGPPIGGIGSGCITRSWMGDFTRWHILKAAWYENGIVPVDVFSLRTKRPSEKKASSIVLNCSKENPRTGIEHWQWWNSSNTPHPSGQKHTPEVFKDMNGRFYSLYPRSWTSYDQPKNKLRLTCRQFSPVISQNYKETSYPVGLFVWTVENQSDEEAIEVSLMFTFQNGTGSLNDTKGGHSNAAFKEEGICSGVNMYNVIHNTLNAQSGSSISTADPLMFSVAGKEQVGQQVSVCKSFDPSSHTETERLWKEFSNYGALSTQDDYIIPSKPTSSGQKVAGAVCIKTVIEPKQSKEIVFSLSWDMPIIRFGPSAHYRRYTKYYGKTGKNAQQISRDAVMNYEEWEKQIEGWQAPVLKKKKLPNWYKSALFNELYYIVDGGTTWTNGLVLENPENRMQQIEAEAHKEHFAYLEGHEYVMFNTYDVHFYASHALVRNWPNIQLSLQRDFARSVLIEHSEMREWKASGQKNLRKKRGCLPHDIGTMDEYPWVLTNAYNLQDTNRWKDLNSEFVLSVYRDYEVTKNMDFLKECWDSIELVINYHLQFDKDHDGVIENEGFPDSTYDNWTTTGMSAFSGGLWLACLRCAVEIAKLVGKTEKAQEYQSLLDKGIQSYESKLWDEKEGYYIFDTSQGPHSDSIMADQLQGHHFLQSAGLKGLLSEQRVSKALHKIFQFNVRKYSLLTGLRGAVNGMRPDGTLDKSGVQSKEVWTGTTYTLAATMIYAGMEKEAFETAEGIYATCWDKLGFFFQTPEAYDEKGCYRSLCYMRPLAIWAMQIALERRKQAKHKDHPQISVPDTSTDAISNTTVTSSTT